MKKFFEDYKDLCKHSGRFYKEHWLGTAIVTAIGVAISFAPLAILEIKEHVEMKKLTKNHVEEENDF